MDARTPGAFKILFARIRNKKSGKDEQALCEHTRRREKLAHVSIKIVRQQPVGIRDRFDVVPRIFWQAIIIERRTKVSILRRLPRRRIQLSVASRTTAGAAA